MYRSAFTAEELYIGLNPKYLRSKRVRNCKVYPDRKKLASKVFNDCLREILFDIINNNVTFVVPLSFGEYGEIYMSEVDEEKFKEIYQRGGFQDIDFVKSEFKNYNIRYMYKTRSGYRSKPIYVYGDLRTRFKELINSGKKW